jgi:hypothetical protein
MSKATQALRDFLTASPSVVFPYEVLELLGPVEAENTKLREELAKWERLAAGIDIPEYPVTQFEPKDLERENEKLRDMVRDMWNGMCARAECRHCEHYELRDRQRFVGECEFHRRMRELGIEVKK